MQKSSLVAIVMTGTMVLSGHVIRANDLVVPVNPDNTFGPFESVMDSWILAVFGAVPLGDNMALVESQIGIELFNDVGGTSIDGLGAFQFPNADGVTATLVDGDPFFFQERYKPANTRITFTDNDDVFDFAAGLPNPYVIDIDDVTIDIGGETMVLTQLHNLGYPTDANPSGLVTLNLDMSLGVDSDNDGAEDRILIEDFGWADGEQDSDFEVNAQVSIFGEVQSGNQEPEFFLVESGNVQFRTQYDTFIDPAKDLCDFDGSGELDLGDVNLLSAAIREGANEFDLTGDGLINGDDLKFFIGDESKLNTWLGDANLDGEFNEVDLVAVFQGGLYETGDSATWDKGDWNADGEFNSGDLVDVFIEGGFQLGTRGAGSSATGASSPPGAEDAPVNDGVSLLYDPSTGNLSVHVDNDLSVTALEIVSLGGLFTGPIPDNLDGMWDIHRPDKLFKLLPAGFGSIDLGPVLPTALAGNELLLDVLIDGALFGGGDLAAAGASPVLVHPDFLLGDYNSNGVVDAADYNVWRDTFGSTDDLRADGNDNGVIDAADYNAWRDNFGNTAVAHVPEPASMLLLLLASVAICWKRPKTVA